MLGHLLCLSFPELEGSILYADADSIPFFDFPANDFLGKGCFHRMGEQTAQRPCAKIRLEAAFGKSLQHRIIPNERNPDLFLETIRSAKEKCDCLIVFVHWGSEGKEETDSWQEKQAVQFAEAGADVIIGDHPHVLQKIVSVNGVPCVFSLGNYLFNSKTLDTGLAEVTLDSVTAEVTGIRFIPAVQSGCRTRYADGADKERILEKLRKLSNGTMIDENGYITF